MTTRLVPPAAALLAVLLLPASVTHAVLDAYAGVNDKGTGIVDVTHDGSTAQAIGIAGGVNGNGHASASFGILHAYSHGTANNTAGYAYVTAGSSFTDSLIITGGTGTGYLLTDFLVDGSTLNGGGVPSAGLSWSNSSGNVLLFAGTNTLHGTVPLAFTFGVPFDFTASLTTLVTWGNAGGFGEGLADFGNTATLTNISVLDSSQTPLSNFTVTGSSGTNYLALAVPEPSSLGLLAISSVALLARRQRRLF